MSQWNDWLIKMVYYDAPQINCTACGSSLESSGISLDNVRRDASSEFIPNCDFYVVMCEDYFVEFTCDLPDLPIGLTITGLLPVCDCGCNEIQIYFDAPGCINDNTLTELHIAKLQDEFGGCTMDDCLNDVEPYHSEDICTCICYCDDEMAILKLISNNGIPISNINGVKWQLKKEDSIARQCLII